ncbi:MAG: hypothetical protein WBP18_11330 [Paracoccaceae bacterium]|jgi:hypothetical protein
MAKRPMSGSTGKERMATRGGAVGVGVKAPAARTVAAGGLSPSTTVPVTGAAAGAATIAATGGGPDDTRGRVAGYTVGRQGLVVKLDCSAIYRLAFSVGADEPHFRSAVSMTMIALNNRVNPATQSNPGYDQQYLWVRLESGTKSQKIRPALVVAMSNSTDNDPFDIDGFVFNPNL